MVGHRTEDCYELWYAVKQLIRKGRGSVRRLTKEPPKEKILDEERRNPRHQRTSELKKGREDHEEMETVTRTINVIAKGFVSGGTMESTRKKHL